MKNLFIIFFFTIGIVYASGDQAHNTEWDQCYPKTAEFVFLKNKSLAAFPPHLFYMRKLKSLTLSNNSLSEIPMAIGIISSLKELFLDHNELTALPDSFSKLKKLTTLDISHNKFTELPAAVIILTRPFRDDAPLNMFHLVAPGKNNELRSYAKEIKLKKLSFSDNPLTFIPAHLQEYPYAQESAECCAIQ